MISLGTIVWLANQSHPTVILAAFPLDLTGTRCTHFDEDIFDGELLTAYVDDASNPSTHIPSGKRLAMMTQERIDPDQGNVLPRQSPPLLHLTT